VFRVLDIESDFGDFVSVEADRSTLRGALWTAIENSKAQIELINEQIAEMGYGYDTWLDGRAGEARYQELDNLLRELRRQVLSKANLVAVYNRL
jgi:hypothetical protein